MGGPVGWLPTVGRLPMWWKNWKQIHIHERSIERKWDVTCEKFIHIFYNSDSEKIKVTASILWPQGEYYMWTAPEGCRLQIYNWCNTKKGIGRGLAFGLSTTKIFNDMFLQHGTHIIMTSLTLWYCSMSGCSSSQYSRSCHMKPRGDS